MFAVFFLGMKSCMISYMVFQWLKYFWTSFVFTFDPVCCVTVVVFQPFLSSADTATLGTELNVMFITNLIMGNKNKQKLSVTKENNF